MGPIPRLIHQTGPTAQPPVHLLGLQESWQQHNPGIELRFWSDDDLDAFVAAEAPEFLEIFRGYPSGIFRADLGRYLVLRHFGGIYADLDCQCLRPLQPLLAGRSFVIAAEPASHSQLACVQQRGLGRILCPSFLASTPGHPFWETVLEAIRRHRDETDVLDATGPFLLTRAHADWQSRATAAPEASAAAAPEVSVVDSEWLYPFDKDDCSDGGLFDLARWEERTRQAYVAHYWESSWFEPAMGFRRGLPSRVAVNRREPDWPCLREADPPDPDGDPADAEASSGALPLVSCLMVSRGRVAMALVAVECFLRQTYPERELVLVDDDPDDGLERALAGLDCSRIRHVRLPDQGLPLGALRNISLEQARGDYVCQWDDDDLHDPARLEMQLRALRQSDGQACVLVRWLAWWPRQQRLALSNTRHWEGSLLCERSLMPRYPELRRGEDTAVMQRLLESVRVVRLDLPRLYVYVAHGANTFAADHFEAQWHAAALRWPPEAHPRLLSALSHRLPIRRYLEALAQQERSRPQPAAPAQPGVPAEGGVAEPEQATAEPWPTVLIATPMKNVRPHLPRYFSLLERLDYDPARLSLAVLEGDSDDGSHAALQHHLEALRPRWRRLQLQRWHAHPPRTRQERWQSSFQRQRRRTLAIARNRLLQASLADEQWVLWLDADLLDYPPDLLRQLLHCGRDVVTPHCRLPDGSSFDLNTFRYRPGHGPSTERREHLRDGLLQPPRGGGRVYLEAFPEHPVLEVDSVGGTALLVRADLHREGLLFPPDPVDGFIETEGFARLLRGAGHRCWALPWLSITHPAC